jgi:hypothetical protein
MSREHPLSEDDLLDAIREDELANALAQFHAQEIDDADDWA